MIPFTQNPRKNELMYSERKQSGSHQGLGGGEEVKEQEAELKRSTRKLLKEDGYVHYPRCG